MNPSSSLRVQGGLQKDPSDQPSPTPEVAILNLVRLVAGDTSLVSELSQNWVVRQFQLGDELANYVVDAAATDSSNVIYLVCQGRVRLLGFNQTLGREVSTQLVSAEQTFGADHFFCHQTLPYRAIAASDGFVISTTTAELKPWLQAIPQLKSYLQRLTSERQALIFFKTYTKLHSLKTKKLQELLPYLIAKHIPNGTSLLEATPSEKGRFWLASGQVQSISIASFLPMVGDSWGYPESTLPDGTAQTDLLIYQLSAENWDLARAIAPDYFTESYQPIEAPVEVVNVVPADSKPQIALPKLQNLRSLTAPAIATSDIEDIDFPQGVKQHKSRSSYSYPFIQQQSSSDCGAACLAMISQYWGKRLSLYSLRNLAQVDRNGASLEGLTVAAQTLGYDVLPVRGSLPKLEWHYNPWVAHWQGNHYVVVWQIKGDRVLISDPAVGRKWLSRPQFETSWTGYALLLDPTESFQALKSEKFSLGRYGQTLWNYRTVLRQIILASLLVQVFGLATPLFTQVILDQVMPIKNLPNLHIFAFSFLCLGIWRTVLTAQHQNLLDYFANRIDLSLIGGFINYTLQLPLQFFASRQVDDIISRVQENRKIQLFISRRAIGAAVDILMVMTYLGLMTYYSWQLTLLVLSWIIPVVILTVVASPYLKQASREIFQESARQHSSMVEIMTGVATVKTATAERPLQKYWEERFLKMLKVRLRGQKLAHRLQVTRTLINHVGSTLVLWFGATLVMGGKMSLGQFVAFNMLTGNVTHPVLSLVGLWDEFQEILISVERLNDVYAAVPEASSQTTLLVMPPIRGEVRFENVSFRYNSFQERNALQNISFGIKPQQTIGIIGQSGSGKSTLANLLAGLYRPDTGRILIDGHDMAGVSPQSLRSQVGLVAQDSFLFSGTILENITLHDQELSLIQAIAAAKLTGAHDFIQALPLGYDTQVGERGFMLSGGQRQKIAIARALVRNPKILILDEATSGLDAESERRFQQNLAQISQERTTFIVSHRLSTVRYADHIFVIDQGMVIEHGTHQELMAIAGLYHHLAQLQL
ncbi:cysteine peptidase family C39 domain-containing protein [Anabaena sp. FACHB-709]|uniref:Heterocyst differentiation protein HetC n=2 Tax=Nostocaceae TaxID=1162 RepID=A0A1Z4KHJ9_ANAVA|nr:MULTISPECIES: cysteine peptidase family C39 domain-containing protein [Nostocaceae]BAY68441.1 heterocyst differentiation protein HetC [Trichormus variabilis NIES-23]HBW32669.1 peptidase C39 [Nostoc sp. UBA8866]MBD2171749.1 ATP-binding cassette domain-containing protein [Anabaena cylindrica FACHB-318]MBD2264268.1 ATP-binding cassette domain-containing protein [Anabaena sp. FACHB-709]MBD2273611.1 ATP-binding cassette domain-containing protein [Nostoc sp. PCC 7120 = FACHB-418]